MEKSPQIINNLIYIEFLNKKDFPPGDWSKEPDYCEWKSFGFNCLALRDMKLGIWRGFVALTKDHKGFNKSLHDLVNEKWALDLEIHGGLSIAGKLPAKYKELNKDTWWLGFEATSGEDLLPLIKLDINDPIHAGIIGYQTYKNFHFIRRETKKLALQLMKVK